ncbi:MarR family winged helix-turn-helix transcriptional regulator [Chloroflexota bacterium]
MEEQVSRDEVYHLWVLLLQTRDAMLTARENELKEVGVSMIQAGILFMVNTIPGPATPNEISRWIFRKPQTVHVVLKQMVKHGLVRKTKDLERRNMVRISLTRKGKQALAESQEKLGVLGEIMSCLSQEERSQLQELLKRVRAKTFAKIDLKDMPFPEAATPKGDLATR